MNWYNDYSGPLASNPNFGILLAFGGLLLAIVLLWSLFWKGMALWKAARQGDKAWFVILLVVNTLGILEILYIYVFSKKPGKVE